jgi:hypothetical protein
MKVRLSVLAACALLGVAVLAAHAPAAGSKVYFPSSCTNTKYKPTHVIIACGDAALRVNQLTWKHWGAKTATGKGVGATNTCNPSCAQGKFEHDPAKVRLSRPKLCASVDRTVFTRLELTFTAGRPFGINRSTTFPFPCSLLGNG